MKDKLQRMQWTLASMQRLREQYPNNVCIEAPLEEAKCKLDVYQKIRTTNAYRSKAASWMRVGDRVTKGPCLKKSDGTMTTCEEEMLEMATSYYMQRGID